MIMVELFGLGVLFSVDGRTDRTRRTPKMAPNSSPEAVTVDMFLLTMVLVTRVSTDDSLGGISWNEYFSFLA